MGSVQTRSMTVNAAFLKDIKDDNRDLKRLFDRVSELTFHRQVAINHWAELGNTIDQLLDQIAMHFSLEEAYGYFDNAISVATELTRQSEILRNQHAVLFQQLVEIDDLQHSIAPQRSPEVDHWVAELKQFIRQFAAHEEAELKLILSAIDDDLGVGD